MKRRIRGGLLAIIGYILSPLSWWNDLVVNIPIAYLFGCLFCLISKSLFLPAMIVGYWITNIAGLILLHKGVVAMVQKEKKAYGRRDLLKDLAISIAYTLVIVILVWSGILKSPMEYFQLFNIG